MSGVLQAADRLKPLAVHDVQCIAGARMYVYVAHAVKPRHVAYLMAGVWLNAAEPR